MAATIGAMSSVLAVLLVDFGTGAYSRQYFVTKISREGGNQLMRAPKSSRCDDADYYPYALTAPVYNAVQRFRADFRTIRKVTLEMHGDGKQFQAFLFERV